MSHHGDHLEPVLNGELDDTGEVVRVTDARQESTRWPDFSDTAIRVGVAGVAGIPMRLADEIIGALDIETAEPREWSDENIAVAVVLRRGDQVRH